MCRRLELVGNGDSCEEGSKDVLQELQEGRGLVGEFHRVIGVSREEVQSMRMACIIVGAIFLQFAANFMMRLQIY